MINLDDKSDPEKYVDIKNDQRLPCLFEFFSSNASISFTLLGFCLTSLIFLFSILPLYSIDMFSKYATYILLMMGITFLLISSFVSLRNKTNVINFLYSDEINDTQESNKKIDHFLNMTKRSTYFIYIGISCFFLGTAQVLAALFEEGWNLWILIALPIVLVVVIFLLYLPRLKKTLSKRLKETNNRE